MYEVTKTELKIQSTFKYNDKMMKNILKTIKTKLEEFCQPKQSIVTKIEIPNSAKKTILLLHEKKLKYYH